MLTAAYKAGVAFSKSYVGYVHAVAHSLGGQYNIPHGLANSVLLPVVLEEYGAKIHKKLYELAVFSGIADESDSIEAGAEKFIAKIKALPCSKTHSIRQILKLWSDLCGAGLHTLPKRRKGRAYKRAFRANQKTVRRKSP